MAWLDDVVIAADQLVNTLLGGRPDETLSARAHRQHLKGRSTARNVINAIYFLQADHCLTAYQSEVRRRQLPDEYRKPGA